MLKLIPTRLLVITTVLLVILLQWLIPTFDFIGIEQNGFIIDSCGIVIETPGVYVIVKDLDVIAGICIEVKTNNVVIDGGGHVIEGVMGVDGGGDVAVLVQGNNVTIMNTVLQNVFHGIVVTNSNNVFINSNRFVNVSRGVALINSSSVALLNNTFINSGLFLRKSYGNIVVNNTVNGKPLVYLENVRNVEVKEAGQVFVIRSSNVTIRDLVLTKTPVGVYVADSRFIMISNLSISHSMFGISFSNVSFGIVTNNNLLETTLVLEESTGIYIVNNTFNHSGITFINSSGNVIFFNDFHTTMPRFSFLGNISINTWSSLVELDYIYIVTNTTHRSKLGNFWEFCSLIEDENGDGIGDQPCRLDQNNVDYYPLVSPRSNYKIGIGAPAVNVTISVTPTPKLTTPTPTPTTPTKPGWRLDEVSRMIVPVTIAVIIVVTLISIFILGSKFMKTK